MSPNAPPPKIGVRAGTLPRPSPNLGGRLEELQSVELGTPQAATRSKPNGRSNSDAQEGGRLVSPKQVQEAVATWVSGSAPMCGSPIPTLLDMEHACRRQQKGKAPGPDLVLNELWPESPAYAREWFWGMCVFAWHSRDMNLRNLSAH